MTAIRSVSPTFSSADAIGLAKSLYGLSDLMGELPSERDQNFLFRRDDRRQFTLKIANRDEARSALELQNKAMGLVGHGLAVIPTLDGQAIGTTRAADGTTHFVRLVTFIPGVPLGDFRPHSPRLLADLGRLLGRADKALEKIDRKEGTRNLYWDIRHAEQVVEGYKDLIGEVAPHSIVERILADWRRLVVPRLPSMRTSVIHNDANDYNLIVTVAEAGESVGLIDFGDMLETYTVCEPAIACAYAMLSKPDPIAAAADVIGGYHETHPLTEVEIELIYHFIRTRLAMSVTIAAHQKKLEPDNEYLRISERPAWALLQKLDSIHPRLAHYTFRNACRLPACPASASVVAFLGTRTTEFHPVVDGNLAGSDAVVLDLSVGSLEIGTRDEVEDTARFTKALFRRMEDAGARIGIGRYDEPRGIYTSPLFSQESNDGSEWRTVHLGIDIFMPAESPVYAPMDGVVHSVKNNDAALDYGPTIILRHEIGDSEQFFTLYGHLSVDSLGLKLGKKVRRGEQIAKIGMYPTNGGWPPHLHFQIITDMLDRDGEFPGVAAPGQRAVWLSLSPDPNMILGIPLEKFPAQPPTRDETLAARRRFIGPNLSIAYKTPLKIVRGAGAWLYDEMGRGYLDCVNNVAHVGHCHPRVVRAAQQQMAVLNTNTRYLHDNIIDYARRLTAKLPPSLSVCFFVNSGSEANDLALRIARAHTRAKDMIVMETAYHGNLTSLIEISPYKFDSPGGEGAPAHVHKLSLADGYRVKVKDWSGEVRAAIAEMARRDVRPAAFIMESLLSCAGQVVLPSGYLAEAYRDVRAAGGVCLADEVQVGFGRVGTHFWGFETQDVVPDIVTLGKSIGNGHPLGAVVTTAEIAASFNNGMEYFNTFGGNPVSCAVGVAVLDVIEDERLQENAWQVGNLLKTRLAELQSRHPLIGDVRGLGLFVGIELVLDRATLEPAPVQTSYIVDRMRDRGVLLSTDGPFHNVIKFKPPMVFSIEDAEVLISSLDLTFAETETRSTLKE